MNAILWTVAAVWLWFLLRSWRAAGSLERLPATGGPSNTPTVSVVIAARDEAAHLPACCASLLRQRGVDLELIVVDDRSSDRTPDLLREIAADPRVVPLRIDVLPERWLGKCWALAAGAQRARGAWLLFSDADTTLAPDTLARAIATAERDGADHLTLTPGHGPVGAWTEAALLAFHAALARQVVRVNRDAPGAFCGVGAFNLVRRTAYAAIGGHEALRLEVIDDVMLGLLVRRAGLRSRGYLGADDLTSGWGASLPEILRVLEKNAFAVFAFSIPTALGALGAMVALWTLAALGWLAGTPAGLAALLALLLNALPCARLARRQGWRAWPAALYPFGVAWILLAFVRSVALGIARRGIRWRGTFYSLRALRAGRVWHGLSG